MTSLYCPRCDFGPLNDVATCRRCGASLVAELLPVPELTEPEAPPRISSRPPSATPPPSASPPPPPPNSVRPIEGVTSYGAPTLIAAPDERPNHARAALFVAVTCLVIGAAWIVFAYAYGFDLLLFGPRLILSPTVALGLVIGAIVGVAAASGSGPRRDEITGVIGLAGAVALGIGGNLLAVDAIGRHETEKQLERLSDREYLVTFVADDVLDEERAIRRDPVPGPNTSVDRPRRRSNDYPAGIWARANQRYDAMGDAEREAFLAEREAHLRASVDEELVNPWGLPRLAFLVLTAIGAGGIAVRGRLGRAEI